MRPVEPIVGSDPNSIVTPEAVALTLDYAELGSRSAAVVVDTAILTGCVIALEIVVGLLSLPGVVAVAIFLVVGWGYFPFFEEIWHGQTPGKRIFKLRVVRTDGRAVGLGPVLLRNLLRPVDLIVFLGLILILVTRRRQRLGDMAAGTLVVRYANQGVPAPVQLHYPPNPYVAPLDTTMVNEQEYGLIRSFLERRNQLDPGARAALAGQLAGLVRSRVPGAAEAYGWADEVLLEAALTAVRHRSPELPPSYPPPGPVMPPGWDPRAPA